MAAGKDESGEEMLEGATFAEAVAAITTNDDERPSAELEEAVILSLLRAGSLAACKPLVAMVVTRLSVPQTRVKIKTLNLIITALTSPHRTADSKFRPAVQVVAPHATTLVAG